MQMNWLKENVFSVLVFLAVMGIMLYGFRINSVSVLWLTVFIFRIGITSPILWYRAWYFLQIFHNGQYIFFHWFAGRIAVVSSLHWADIVLLMHSNLPLHGADCPYQDIADRMESQYAERTCLSYLDAKIRHYNSIKNKVAFGACCLCMLLSSFPTVQID